MCRLAKHKPNKANLLNLYHRDGGLLRETYKSQNINPTSPTPKFIFGIIMITVKSLSAFFSAKFNKINLSVQFQYLIFQPEPEVRGMC